MTVAVGSTSSVIPEPRLFPQRALADQFRQGPFREDKNSASNLYLAYNSRITRLQAGDIYMGTDDTGKSTGQYLVDYYPRRLRSSVPGCSFRVDETGEIYIIREELPAKILAFMATGQIEDTVIDHWVHTITVTMPNDANLQTVQ